MELSNSELSSNSTKSENPAVLNIKANTNLSEPSKIPVLNETVEPATDHVTEIESAGLSEDVIRFEEAVDPLPSGSAQSSITHYQVTNDTSFENMQTGQAQILALLFRSNQPPESFEISRLNELVSKDENFVWVDLTGFDETGLHNLTSRLDLHPLAVRAVLQGWQRPRFDSFRIRKHFLVSATVAHLNSTNHQILAAELDLFVGNNFLLSVHKGDLPFLQKIKERASQSPELVQLDAAFMLYIVLDELLEYYEELSDQLEVETGKMELLALKDASDTFLTDLVQLKQYIFALTRLLDQHRKIFAELVRPDNPLTSDENISPFFQDLENHFERLSDTLQPAREAINGAFDIYVSHTAHKTNEVIKALTLVSTIILPTTVIISLFGTNIVGLSQNELLDFALMLLLIGLTITGILVLFRRKGWF